MKKANCFAPDKQRTIHLLEASFSMGAKIIFSRRMMTESLMNGLIPEEQYAKKGSKSIDAATFKVLMFDYMRLKRRNGIVFSNDLMNCYDRMHHTALGFALRYLGAPSRAVQCVSTTIQEMRHHIRTAYGDSLTYYGGMRDELLSPFHPLH